MKPNESESNVERDSLSSYTPRGSRYSDKNSSNDFYTSSFNLKHSPSSAYVSRVATRHASTNRRTPKKRFPLKNILIILAALLLVGGIVFGVTKLVGAIGNGNNEIVAGQDVTVEIPEGSPARTIASILKDAGVISSTTDFLKYVTDNGYESALAPGTFNLKTGMSNEDVVEALLTAQEPDTYTFTLPEGVTRTETAEIIAEASGGAVSVKDFQNTWTENFDAYVEDYPFLKGAYRDSLEGFLCPNTYNVYVTSTADTIIRMLLDQFQTVIYGIDMSYAESHGYSVYDVVTMASLIEREAVQDDERTLVSAVIYNRLNDGMKLQFCSTVNYIVQHSGAISYEEMEIDSKYNTYVYAGLPAGPICSPGEESLKAAANPAKVDLFYFKTDSEFESGRNVFSEDGETYKEASAWL